MKLNIPFFNRFSKTVLVFLLPVLLIYFACSKNSEQGGNSIFSSQPLMDLKYEMESLTTASSTLPIEKPLDMAYRTPRASRQNIKMKLFEDGQFEMATEVVEPKVTGLNAPLPNVIKTITDNHRIRMFDKNGKIVMDQPFETPRMTELVAQIKKMAQKYPERMNERILLSLQGGAVLSDFLNDAKAKGATIDSDNSIISVKQSINLPRKGAGSEGENSLVSLFNAQDSSAIGARLYNPSNQLLLCINYRYEMRNNTRRLKGMNQFAPTTLPSGQRGIISTDISLDNISINVNN